MYAALKRASDIVGAIVLSVVLFPLLLGIAAAIRLTGERRVLFRQMRMGRNGKPFCILKFRTMRADTPPNVAFAELPDPDSWITPLGRFLRRTSADELPQLWNILKGEMSFVGPRPVVLSETRLLEERARLGADTCRPGLTGLSQVKGRATLAWREKAWYDALYAHHCCGRLDAWIVWKTVPGLLHPEQPPARNSPRVENT